MPSLALEDNFEDILQKARDGLGLSMEAIAQQCHTKESALRALFSGTYDRAALAAVAPLLGLDVEALVAIAEHTWHPEVATPEGLLQIISPFDKGMTVNAYLLKIPHTPKALLFDTGTSTDAINGALEANKLSLEAIFLTHTHGDHIAVLDELLATHGKTPVYVHENEKLKGSKAFREGESFAYETLTVETRLTSGHSPGGTTYLIDTKPLPLAIVGDAIFAGSMGRGFVSYKEALRNNLEQIMTLPGDTILCPGHGPLSSVNEERAHNPFMRGAI